MDPKRALVQRVSPPQKKSEHTFQVEGGPQLKKTFEWRISNATWINVCQNGQTSSPSFRVRIDLNRTYNL